MKILHLFPDTNAFVQCRALHELDWSEYEEFDEIRLIVCTPVQREIDRHKARGNDRLGRRSRKVHQMFREIIVGGDAYIVVRESHPRVSLLFEPSCRPDPALAGDLDYTETDDRIVGCVHGYRERNPHWDVRLLTHDSGPMATARMVSVPFVPVPDGWLRPPEPTDAERENRRLREEIAHLKSAEPRFSIAHSAGEGGDTDLLEFEWPSFAGLSGEEVGSLVESLKRKIPLVTEFGFEEAKGAQPIQVGAILLNVGRRFEPPSQQEIDQYAEIAYPDWIERCEGILQRLPAALEHHREPVVFSFFATNEGSCPGKQVLVTITARGNFLVRPPRESDGVDETDAEDSAQELVLPSPPKPPTGRWTSGYGAPLLGDMVRAVSALQHASNPLDLAVASLVEPLELRRDPNKFYYKPDWSPTPSQSFSLECEQWRHGIAAEVFEGELWVEPGTKEVRGALEFEIHAANLRRPAKRVVQVRGQAKPFDVNVFAREVIRDMSKRA